MNDVLTLAAQYGPWAFFVVWATERYGAKVLTLLSSERKTKLKREEEERKRRQLLADAERQRKIQREERMIQAIEIFSQRLTEIGVILQSIVRRQDEHEQNMREMRNDVAVLVDRQERERVRTAR